MSGGPNRTKQQERVVVKRGNRPTIIGGGGGKVRWSDIGETSGG